MGSFSLSFDLLLQRSSDSWTIQYNTTPQIALNFRGRSHWASFLCSVQGMKNKAVELPCHRILFGNKRELSTDTHDTNESSEH